MRTARIDAQLEGDFGGEEHAPAGVLIDQIGAERYGLHLARIVVQLNTELEIGILILGIQLRRDFKIADVHVGRGPEIHVAEDAAHPPEILVLQIGSVAPAEVLDRQQILSRL